MPETRYFYRTCPLCLEVVDITQPTCYRVLTLNPEHAEFINETPRWGKDDARYKDVSVGDLRLADYSHYRDVEYAQMAWVLNTRRLDFVRGLAVPKLYLLMHLSSLRLSLRRGNLLARTVIFPRISHVRYQGHRRRHTHSDVLYGSSWWCLSGGLCGVCGGVRRLPREIRSSSKCACRMANSRLGDCSNRNNLTCLVALLPKLPISKSTTMLRKSPNNPPMLLKIQRPPSQHPHLRVSLLQKHTTKTLPPTAANPNDEKWILGEKQGIPLTVAHLYYLISVALDQASPSGAGTSPPSYSMEIGICNQGCIAERPSSADRSTRPRGSTYVLGLRIQIEVKYST